MASAAWWKGFYADEREALGPAGLLALLERAAPLSLPAGGALVVPHVRLAAGGAQVARVARALVESGADEVLAIGVLHGGRERDAEAVRRTRGGSATEIARLRGVHGPGAPGDAGLWTEEFSLDGLEALVAAIAAARGVAAPRLLARYPFLVGDRVDDLPGLEDLARLAGRGIPVVATADHVHHGIGYGLAPERCVPSREPRALSQARRSIEASLELLRLGNLPGFRRFCSDAGSDFRDVGPVLANLLSRGGRWECGVLDLALADYDDVLRCPAPTWVAAALVEMRPDATPLPPAPLGRCG